jgi:hypothetical protein
MKRLCAWCGGELDPASAHDESETVTHGICPACSRLLEVSAPSNLQAFLDGYSEPILCVDGAGRVLAANRAFARAVDRVPEGVHGFLCGDVFSCRNAGRPGGCGRTERCLTCALRGTLDLTVGTGRGVACAKAYVIRDNEDGSTSRIDLVISTELHGAVMLLRIDQMVVAKPLPETPEP